VGHSDRLFGTFATDIRNSANLCTICGISDVDPAYPVDPSTAHKGAIAQEIRVIQLNTAAICHVGSISCLQNQAGLSQ
jgi:hypothetical protein